MRLDIKMNERIKRAIEDPSQAIKILRCRTWKLFGHYDYKKFIVLTRNRTGSNMLISMLNSHPSIYARYESFRTLNGISVDKVMNMIYSKYPRFVKAVGCKIFYHHPVDDKSGALWDKLTQMEGLNVIHLKRKNILRTILSHEIAKVTDTWVRKEGGEINNKKKRVQMYEDKLHKEFKKTREWEAYSELIFKHKPMVEVYYEDLVSKQQTEFRKITDMLNLNFFTPKKKFRKQNPEKLSDLIINYESIKKSFAETEWSQFFEE